LKVGAPVVLVRNLAGGLMNGMLGMVFELQRGHPPIINFGGRIVSLEYVRFEIYDPVKKKCLAARNQYPIKLAYALTVHRAQGMTLSKVEVDCYSFFASDQLSIAVGSSVSTAANLRHPDHVYDFYFQESTEPKADLTCCKIRYESDQEEEENFERIDVVCDNNRNMPSSGPETPVLLDVSMENCPWSLQEFNNNYIRIRLNPIPLYPNEIKRKTTQSKQCKTQWHRYCSFPHSMYMQKGLHPHVRRNGKID